MRLDWVDRWKGLLILLVVVGHVVGAACHVSTGGWSDFYRWAYRAIYVFHMPAFFAVLGVCWHRSEVGFGRFAKNRARRLLVPYLVFALASAVIYWLFAGAAHEIQQGTTTTYYTGFGWRGWGSTLLSILHAGRWPNGRGFECNSVLWFLPAMFTVSCAYWWLDRLIPRLRHQVAALVVLAAFACALRLLPVGEWPWGLNLVPWFLCFVIVGRMVREVRGVRGMSVVLGWGMYGAGAWWLPDLWLGFASVKWYCVFFFAAVVGTWLSAWTAQVVSVRALVSLGLASMGVMLTHKFVVLALQLRVSVIRHALASDGWRSGAAALVIVGAAVVASFVATLFLRRYAPFALGEKRRG